jgi:hypothetical protein
MSDEPREHRAKKNIYAFLQRRSLEQRRSYLARGRRFVVLDVGELKKAGAKCSDKGGFLARHNDPFSAHQHLLAG